MRATSDVFELYDEIWRTLAIPPNQEKEEFYSMLYEIFDSTPWRPKVMVELGVEYGGTLRFWEHFLADDGLLIGVDETFRIAWPWLESEKNIHHVQCKTQDSVPVVSEILRGRTIDFLYSDAGGDGSRDHVPKYAEAEYRAFLPLMSRGGVVGFDDINLIRSFTDGLDQDRLHVMNGRTGKERNGWYRV